MILRFSQIISVFILSLLFALFALAGPSAQSISRWAPEPGDVFRVDVTTNTGYLTHVSDGLTMSFPVGSGQKRWVYYIGRYYFAATPEEHWVVKSQHTLPDRWTFGSKGQFLRLYKNGEKRTSYGIHTIVNADRIMQQDDRYKSMGCILVDDAMMEMLIKTFETNGGELKVTTFAS